MCEFTNGQVALVTGAAGGIGRACAIAFARAGADLVISDLDEAMLAETQDAVSELGQRAVVAPADVTDVAAVQRMVDTAVAEVGRIDILVNSAGILRPAVFDELTEMQWDTVMAVNLKGVFLCAQATLRVMSDRRSGVIVNIGSLAGQVGGVVAPADYAASKAGVICLTKSLAKFAAPCGVRVNCINPGVIDTAIIGAYSPEQREGMIANTALGRLGRPEEVASVAVFLASDRASFITGEAVQVNGGLHV
jgi:3-oxoacyl-[acyl-carrier protein] reductase